MPCQHLSLGSLLASGAFCIGSTFVYLPPMPTKDDYAALAETHWNLPIKGKANPYTSMNGNIFSFLSKEGEICLRLSKDNQTAYWQAHGREPVTQYGSVMQGYVALSDDVLKDTDLSARWFDQCLADARALPAKPTKKS